ncbi:hypothetical protein A3K78_09405 [Candidatus Bathyarchaeota archaeon RBG_13_52_12]|nr:MAG: hypothetical protein A3K78_09405 [Candidatus Bathyarchaeota archaeon RBG_13_52_12]
MATQKPSDELFLEMPVNDYNSWPYRPSDILKIPNQEPGPVKEITNWYERELELSDNFLKDFISKKLAVISWLIAALIGIIGNLAVSILFATEFFLMRNIALFSLSIIILIVLIVAFFNYYPKLNYTIKYFSDYLDFPSGYEQYVTKSQLNVYSNFIIQYNNLPLIVNDYGSLVRMKILCDHLRDKLTNYKYIHISDVTLIDKYLPLIIISISTNFEAFITPKNENKIRDELHDLLHTLLQSKTLCNAMAFETDKEEWHKHGSSFLNVVSNWDFDKMRTEIIKKIRTRAT